MDFVHDQLAIGRKLRVLTLVNIFSKYSPVVDPRFSYRAEEVVRTLEGVCPKSIRVDQGSEFVSRDLDLWAYANGVTLDFSRQEKSTDHALIEGFDSKLRSVCLNARWFMSLDDALVKMGDWRRYYNKKRPQSESRQNTLIQMRNFAGASSLSPAKEAENASLR